MIVVGIIIAILDVVLLFAAPPVWLVVNFIGIPVAAVIFGLLEAMGRSANDLTEGVARVEALTGNRLTDRWIEMAEVLDDDHALQGQMVADVITVLKLAPNRRQMAEAIATKVMQRRTEAMHAEVAREGLADIVRE